MLGPVTASYAGKTVNYFFIVVISGFYIFCLVRFKKGRKSGSKEISATGIIALGLTWAVLASMALWSIYVHRPY